ncbi:hypothetical protein [Chitinophaga filiformis]|uniref:Uncharacterized protein n=1 Tax=Chitinophaga filiformis TaxID=104663 RepID=A0ABY4HZZ9_CHIFI|nr:hypothetical protein [Chitinophaga filiformis]UPK69132.1 hypothetical protein MYF79_29675 [Chitinophaga filiformis]
MEKDRSSVMVAIFKRKGGEGVLTKIVTEENSILYTGILKRLKEGEKGIIVYFNNEQEWSLLTNRRVIAKPGAESVPYEILFDNLVNVEPAFLLERAEGIAPGRFSRLILTDKTGEKYILKSESGDPVQGMFQVLWFLLK